jgi:RNA polymerase sigma-70 factor (ECF subfamily)
MSGDNKFHVGYLALRRQLTRFASGLVPPREVEDIVQESYVRICEMANTEHVQHPRSYMYRMVRNLALDHIKRAESRLTSSLNDDDDVAVQGYHQDMAEDFTFNKVAAKEEFEMFCHAVRELPLHCRRVFVLKKVYGYSQKEIATELGISESTVEKHIAFAIRRCSHFVELQLKVGSTSRMLVKAKGGVR